jgi:hypothetical protein
MNEETDITRGEQLEAAPRNIFQRLNAVQQAVEYVKKDTRVEGKYNAVTHDAVTALVRPHFVKHGIVLNVNVLESRVIETGQKSSNGTPLIRYEARFAVHFINMDDPHNYAVFEIDAHANDFGDKAPGKALSYAVKGAVLKALYLETGENDEGRAGGGEDRELTEEEELRLQELRDASLNGMKALEVAWKSMSGKIRLALAPQLASLKEAAQKAQEAPNGSV